MEDVLRQAIADVVGDYAGTDVAVELTYPDEQFGDFATNAALKAAAASGGTPRELAEQLARKVKAALGDLLESAVVAGPGFINFKLNDKGLTKEIERVIRQPLKGQVVVIEFSDPNPFKILHAGHLYTSVVGDTIANLLARAGAEVHRVNYGGDVGLHVAKSLWAMSEELGGENPAALDNIDPSERSNWMSEMYVKGNASYSEAESAKTAIDEINKMVYAIQENDDHNSVLAKMYWTARSWSYDAFDAFYSRLNITFDKFYSESETAPVGIKMVRQQQQRGVFEESDGAVVFRGEKFGLHTRVFITRNGLPTYETKDLGLAELKRRDFNYNRSVIITASEQEQYLKVVLTALEQFEPELADSTIHLTHGMVRLSGGQKMSSRFGNILQAEDVLDAAANAAFKMSGQRDEQVILAAVKYSFLKQAVGGDIVFEPNESVSVLGNSGPYLQYAHARARSILKKAPAPKQPLKLSDLSAAERRLVLRLSRFSSVVEDAFSALAPHLVCAYLFELSQHFNAFYEAERVIGGDREELRLKLVALYADRLKQGLGLLGIDAPNRL